MSRQTPVTVTQGECLRTVRERLSAAGVPDPGLEAELLVRHALGIDAASLYAGLLEPFPAEALPRLDEVTERRSAREPLAYILCEREFYGRSFAVDRRVLIPRPETELLVDRAVGLVAGWRLERPRIADVGTGSGILAVTLALELPEAEIVATDLSPDALEVAASNAARFGVGERVALRRGNLAGPLRGRFQIVVANLPYVQTSVYETAQPELGFEPAAALDGGHDGMRYLGPFVDSLPGVLAEAPSAAILEIDPPLVEAVSERVKRALPGAGLEIVDDLAGLARCAEIRTA